MINKKSNFMALKKKVTNDGWNTHQKNVKRLTRKDHVNVYEDLLHVFSQASLSSKSDPFLRPFKCRRRREQGHSHQRRDYLTRLFEKKKLKDKSLSKKMKTPFDRKLNRSCWPIELGKVSKIKEKPTEKRKEKPTHRSLKRKKFSNPAFITSTRKVTKRSSSTSCSSGSEFLDDGQQAFDMSHFLYEPVTPQMLMDVLQDPEHLKSGATTDMIIAKLRTLKLDLNPSQELLREEVLRKLYCAIKLGLVKENKGYYRIADNVQMNKLPRKKLYAIWRAWCRSFP